MRNLVLSPLILTLFTLLTGLSARAATAPPLAPLSLKDSLRWALDNSPTFDSARKTQAMRELEATSAYAKMLPSLDFTTTNGLQNNLILNGLGSTDTLTTPNPTAPWYSYMNLGITENLYDNGVSWTNSRIANLNKRLASVSYFKSRDSLALDLATEFYHYSLAVALLEVRKQQQDILGKQFKSLTSEYHQGFKNRSDYLRFKAQVQKAQIDRIAAENSLIESKMNLRKIMGVNYKAQDFPDFIPVQITQDQKLVRLLKAETLSMEKAYEFQTAQIQKEINDKTVDLTVRNYWPQVSVTSGVNYSNQNYINTNTDFNSNYQLNWNALLTLTYNLWDWGTRKRDVEVAKFNRDIENNTLDQTLLETDAAMKTLVADMERVSLTFNLTYELLALEQETNRDLERNYREGKISYLDLVTELQNLLDAKVQYYTSYFDVLINSAKYKYYEGKIYDSLVEE